MQHPLKRSRESAVQILRVLSRLREDAQSVSANEMTELLEEAYMACRRYLDEIDRRPPDGQPDHRIGAGNRAEADR